MKTLIEILKHKIILYRLPPKAGTYNIYTYSALECLVLIRELQLNRKAQEVKHISGDACMDA